MSDRHERKQNTSEPSENCGSRPPSSFMAGPAGLDVTRLSTSLPLGERVGRYRLLERIGEGGFGIVYLAEQAEPIRRRVAIKIIKAGMDTQQVIARFEAERQTLALMDHQNIAKVFDAGETDQGKPYFVMELVHGVPVTEYCDQQSLPTEERLRLFGEICSAVQHAHQKGIIHRDIKPGNVLVSRDEDRHLPKVIDFGIAKATQGRLTDKTLFTQIHQLIGTPTYMSPEQATMSGNDIDTRSDIYSLGVLLYELLTGRTPLDAEGVNAGLEEVCRRIREEEPPTPSNRLSSLQHEELTILANQRGVAPSRFSSSLRGDLDWIVMQAVEKDRSRRYETASSFAADIERFLSNKAVHACPPSSVYQARKFIRRNRGSVISISAVLLALLLGLIGTSVGLFRANRETERAVAATATADEEQANARKANEQLQLQLYIHRLAEAQHNLNDRRIGAADELLDSCPPNLRGWEWHCLKRQRLDTPSTIAVETRQQEDLLAFCPDPRFIVSTIGASVAQLYDLSTDEQLRSFSHDSELWSLSVSPNGQILACGTTDWHVHLWDIESGTHIAKFHAKPKGDRMSCCVESIDFSPDSSRLAFGSHDKRIHIWDVSDPSTPLEVRTLIGHDKLIEDVEFSPDGSRLASASHDETIRIWDLESDEYEILEGHEHYVTCVAWTPDGKQLISGGWDASVKIWDVESGQARTLPGHSDYVIQVCVSPDGTRIASVDEFSLRLWDLKNGVEVMALPGQKCVGFSSDGNSLAAGAEKQLLIVWNGASTTTEADARLLHTLHGHEQGVMSAAFSPDGSQLATSAMDHTVRRWDTDLGRETQGPRTANLRMYSVVSFSPDGRLLAAGGRPYSLTVWDLETSVANSFTGGPPNCLAFNSRGLLAIGHSGAIELLDPKSLEISGTVFISEESEESRGSGIWSISFTSNGSYMASGSVDGSIRIWDVETRSLLRVLRDHEDHVWEVACAPNAQILASSSLDGTVRIWNLTTGELIRTLINHYENSYGLAFDPTGKFVAAGSGSGRKGRVVVWEVATGKVVFVISGHTRQVMDVAFRPDGKQLVSASMDKTVKVWDVSHLQP